MLRCWGTLRHEGYLIRVTLAMTYRVAFCLRFSALTRETAGQEVYTGSVRGKFDHKPGTRQEPVSVILWPPYSDLFQKAILRRTEQSDRILHFTKEGKCATGVGHISDLSVTKDTEVKMKGAGQERRFCRCGTPTLLQWTMTSHFNTFSKRGFE